MSDKSDQSLLIKQPLSFGGFLDQCLALYKRFFFQGIIIGALLQGFPKVLMLLMGGFRDNHALNQMGIVVMDVLICIASIYGSLVLTIAAKQVCLGEPVEWKKIIILGKQYFRRVLLAEISTLVWCIFCTLFLIFPGIIALVNCFLVIPVMVVEDTPLRKSWNRSKDLADNNLWRILFGYFACLSLMGLVAFLTYLPILLIPNLDPIFEGAIKVSVEILHLVLLFSFMPIFSTLLYFDICVRKEALDLELQCETLEAVPKHA